MKKSPINEHERRQVIMDAFIVHVVEKGFHKASMAEVAKTAELSVGQIYRYFANKEEIIRAVVERQTEEYLETMELFLDKRDWLMRMFEQNDEVNLETLRALNMEIKAEANRSQALQAIQAEADQRLTQHAIALIRKRYKLDDEADIFARVQFLVSLTEGMFYRSNYFQAPFTEHSHRLFEHMLNELFPD